MIHIVLWILLQGQTAGAFYPMERIVAEGDIAELQPFLGRMVVSRVNLVNLGTLGVVLMVLFEVKQSSSMDCGLLNVALLPEGMEVKFVSHRVQY